MTLEWYSPLHFPLTIDQIKVWDISRSETLWTASTPSLTKNPHPLQGSLGVQLLHPMVQIAWGQAAAAVVFHRKTQVVEAHHFGVGWLVLYRGLTLMVFESIADNSWCLIRVRLTRYSCSISQVDEPNVECLCQWQSAHISKWVFSAWFRRGTELGLGTQISAPVQLGKGWQFALFTWLEVCQESVSRCSALLVMYQWLRIFTIIDTIIEHDQSILTVISRCKLLTLFEPLSLIDHD